MTLRDLARNQVGELDISDLTAVEPWASSSSSHTDINRLRQGKVGARMIRFGKSQSIFQTHHNASDVQTFRLITSVLIDYVKHVLLSLFYFYLTITE